MDTMVPGACVNHVPTMTGGVGHDEVNTFLHRYHFVNAHPAPQNIEIIPVSRTVGTDSIVDEMNRQVHSIHASSTICCQAFHHDGAGRSEIPRYVRGPECSFETASSRASISTWDQASGTGADWQAGPSRSPEIAGAEIARKVLDKTLYRVTA